nr:hypothetical protein GCM10020185_83580 [Pseudomonas brassicacearum subsp. brassicacearum]
MHTLRNFWRLARPFWASEEKKYPALLLLLATVLMTLCLVGVNILTNFWNLHFYNALQALDYHGFLIGSLQFILLQIGTAAFTVGAFHFQQKADHPLAALGDPQHARSMAGQPALPEAETDRNRRRQS